MTFEYHNFINTGKLLYGRDIKQLIPRSTRAQEKSSAKQGLKEIYTSASKHSFYASEPDMDKQAYWAFSHIFRTASIALCGDGRYVSGKRETVSAFHEVYAQKSELCGIISQSFGLWKKWETRSLTKEELQQLTGFCSEFVSEICNLGIYPMNATRHGRK